MTATDPIELPPDDRTPEEKAAALERIRVTLASPAFAAFWNDLRRLDPKAHPTREDRADRYAGRYFSRPDGSGLFRALRGATGAVLLTIRPDDTKGLTDPDELEALLLNGTLVARPDVTPPEGASA